MIPYDDLVAALSAWRTRQGLPVAQVPGAAPARSAGPPPRTAPPGAPPRATTPPLQIAADDFGSDALLEAPYETVGDDYVMQLGTSVIVESAAESTAIGGPPEPVAEGVLVPKRGKRKPDW